MKQILFRADGNSTMGLGHIYRCLALADMVSDTFSCTFAVRNPDPTIASLITGRYALITLPESSSYPDEVQYLISRANDFLLVILDGYHFGEPYQRGWKNAGKKVLVIDDLATGSFCADAIINHAPGVSTDVYRTAGHIALYLGPQYAWLRKPFLAIPAFKQSPGMKSVVVAFGGADPDNFTGKVLSFLHTNALLKEITAITGGAYTHQADLNSWCKRDLRITHRKQLTADQMHKTISSADFAIVPASTILFEVLACGVPALTGYYVDNQKKIYAGFVDKEVVHGVGDFRVLTSEKLDAGIKLLHQEDKTASMKKKLAEVFDGNIRQRVRSIVENLLSV